jgi:endonuclease/exonuclease/phosphatase family metal-dependent hydrolase
MLFGTYNIHYGVGADGRYDVPRIADAVAHADIVCLQEVTRGFPSNNHADHTAEIGRLLNRYYRFHGPMEADASTVAADGTITSRRRSFGNAIVSRWPILWSRGVMLPKTRSTECFDLQRGYIEAVIAVPSGPLRVYCTHLSHVGAEQRLPQVEALMKAVQVAADVGATWHAVAPETFLFQEPSLPVPASAIVAGDFNFTPAHPEYPLATALLKDAWRAAGNTEEEVDSFPREGRIDHIFVTPDLAAKVKRAWIDDDTDASDHWPVFVEFDL